MSPAPKRCLAIQHIAFEHLDGFAGPIEQAGYRIEHVNAADGLARPAARPDLLAVLGGPIGAYEEDSYAFISDELAIIEAQLAGGRAVLGICLGAQLLARALGARVYAAGSKEIGFAPVALSEAGERSCLAPFSDGRPALHWHGDTFDLPDGATLLASTDACANQAFSLGANVIGFQFHPEATGRNIEHWLVGHAAEIAAAGLDAARIRDDAARAGPGLESTARRVAARWLEGLADSG